MSESITNLSDAVAALGALPMPVGPEQRSELDQLRDDVMGACLARWEEEQENARLRLAWQSARCRAWERRDELARLRARVAELEAERHVTNEALDDAVQALRAKESSDSSHSTALPWAALMDDEDLADFLDELADAATTNMDAETRLAEVERACGMWRLIAEAQHGHNTAPGPDAMTRVFVPVASLREPEGEFYGVVHHDYKVGHDLPETGGAS